jgi:phage/conjugal plasmid C-4 type zinc finger TraR family protein
MTDILDMAAEVERLQREAAIARARSGTLRSAGGPQIIDGIACCRECGEPVPAARLAAVAGVSLCVDCAGRQERHDVY